MTMDSLRLRVIHARNQRLERDLAEAKRQLAGVRQRIDALESGSSHARSTLPPWYGSPPVQPAHIFEYRHGHRTTVLTLGIFLLLLLVFEGYAIVRTVLSSHPAEGIGMGFAALVPGAIWFGLWRFLKARTGFRIRLGSRRD